MKANFILLLFSVLLAATPAHACLTRQLSAPGVLADYMSHTLGASSDPLESFAVSFRADKAYYDALTQELCALHEGSDMAAQQAIASADAKIMDQIFDKWQKTGAALAAARKPAAPVCKTPGDCKDYCLAKTRNTECMQTGAALCNNGTCGCIMTCR